MWLGLNFLSGPVILDDKKLNAFLKSNVKQVILVYVVGGLTYGEIAALRYLGKAYSKIDEYYRLLTLYINR